MHILFLFYMELIIQYFYRFILLPHNYWEFIYIRKMIFYILNNSIYITHYIL